MPQWSKPVPPPQTILGVIDDVVFPWISNREFDLGDNTCGELEVPSGFVDALLAACPGAADYIVKELVEVPDREGVLRSAYVSGRETLSGGDKDDGVSVHKWDIRQVLECARRDDKSGKSASGGDDGEPSDKDDDSGEDDSSEDSDEGDDGEDGEDGEDEAFKLEDEVARLVADQVRSGNVERRTHPCMCAHCTRTRSPDGDSVSGSGDGGDSGGSSGSSSDSSSSISRSVVKGFCHGAVCGCLRATVDVTLPGHCQPTRLTFTTDLYHTGWPSPKRVWYVRVNEMLQDAFDEDPDAFYLVAHPYYQHFCRAYEFCYYPADIEWPHLKHHSKHLQDVFVDRARKERDQERAKRCELQKQLAETQKQLAETQKQLALAFALAPAPAPAPAPAHAKAKRKHGGDAAVCDMPVGKQVCVEPVNM